ncbi:MAG: tetratricopeptide repeat protein [Bacteroidota bacterium]
MKHFFPSLLPKQLPLTAILLSLALLWTCQADENSPNEDPTSSAQKQVSDSPEALVRALSLQIDQNPKDYALYESRSQAYYELDSISEAVQDIDQAIRLYRNGPELHYWKGFLAFSQDDTATAMDEYQAAIGLGTQNPETYYQIGQIFFLQNKYEQAASFYQQAAKIDPNEPLYVFAQGFLEESLRHHSKAVPLYLESIRIDSTFDKAYARLHDVYYHSYENEEEAMKYNDLLLSQIPTHPLGQFNQGLYHLRKAIAILNQAELPIFKQRVNDAVVAFTICVNKDPQFVQAWYNRGYCYWLGDGQESRAIEDFQRVVQLQPDHATAHFMLGSIFEKNGDFQTSLHHYEKAASFNPESADFQKAVSEVKARL